MDDQQHLLSAAETQPLSFILSMAHCPRAEKVEGETSENKLFSSKIRQIVSPSAQLASVTLLPKESIYDIDDDLSDTEEPAKIPFVAHESAFKKIGRKSSVTPFVGAKNESLGRESMEPVNVSDLLGNWMGQPTMQGKKSDSKAGEAKSSAPSLFGGLSPLQLASPLFVSPGPPPKSTSKDTKSKGKENDAKPDNQGMVMAYLEQVKGFVKNIGQGPKEEYSEEEMKKGTLLLVARSLTLFKASNPGFSLRQIYRKYWRHDKTGVTMHLLRQAEQLDEIYLIDRELVWSSATIFELFDMGPAVIECHKLSKDDPHWEAKHSSDKVFDTKFLGIIFDLCNGSQSRLIRFPAYNPQ